MVRVIGPKEKTQTLPNEVVINTTSSSKTWTRGLSPFVLGPVKLYAGNVSHNMENGYQFAKVYKHHIGKLGLPTEDYWKWAEEGWKSEYAHRYPMGKGAIPEYTYWNGHKYGYIDARKNVYIPLYVAAVKKSGMLSRLEREYHNNWKCVTLFDFDGYDFRSKGMTFKDVINDPTQKMGHGHVLAMLLEGYIE